MAWFDPDLWRERAWSRYQQATGTSRAAATERWERDVTHISALATLVDWCGQRGIEVVFCKRGGGIYYPEDKCIKISGRMLPERQVFFLLHECGHHLIGDKEKHERFGMGYPQDDPNVKRTFHHRCDIVDEEFEAWHRGFKLAKRLRLRINKERFDRTRAEMLKTYFKWALRTDGYGKDDDDDEEAVA
jgi:hypothetical protein